MGAVKGLLASTDAFTNELVGEFQESIFVRNSRGYNVGTTLFGLMSRLDNETAENLEYNWFERDPVRKTVYSAATSAAATSLQFRATSTGSDGGGNPYLVAGTVLMRNVATAPEFIRITTVPADTTTACTIVRNIQTGGTARVISANESWTIVTVGKFEGADPVAAVYENGDTVTNYIQTYNSTVELTNAFKNSVLRTDIDGPLTDRRIQALERISRDIEFSYFLGVKGYTAGTYGRQYFTGGIYDSIVQAGLASTNVLTNTTGVATLSEFNGFLREVLGYGSDVKLAFCGPRAYSAISNYANSGTNGYRIMQNETVFGMNIQVINTPFGELNLTQHPLFREAGGLSGDYYGLQSWMVIVDLPMLAQKVFEPLFLEPNIQTPGNDSYKEQFRGKLGLKLKFPNAFGVCQQLTSIT
jgi:hypothetical protein